MELGGVTVTFDGPGFDELSSGLADFGERDKRALDGEPGFFGELADGGVEGLFGGIVFALGDGPGSKIFASEVGASGVDEEDFELRSAAEEKDAGAWFGHWV